MCFLSRKNRVTDHRSRQLTPYLPKEKFSAQYISFKAYKKLYVASFWTYKPGSYVATSAATDTQTHKITTATFTHMLRLNNVYHSIEYVAASSDFKQLLYLGHALSSIAVYLEDLVPYSPEISPFSSLTSKFLQRYFYLVYKPPPIHCKNYTISKNEHLAIDKNTVIRSLNSLSSFVSSFC